MEHRTIRLPELGAARWSFGPKRGPAVRSARGTQVRRNLPHVDCKARQEPAPSPRSALGKREAAARIEAFREQAK